MTWSPRWCAMCGGILPPMTGSKKENRYWWTIDPQHLGAHFFACPLSLESHGWVDEWIIVDQLDWGWWMNCGVSFIQVWLGRLVFFFLPKNIEFLLCGDSCFGSDLPKRPRDFICRPWSVRNGVLASQVILGVHIPPGLAFCSQNTLAVGSSAPFSLERR